MRPARSSDQLLFEWPDAAPATCEGAEADDGEYPLTGPDRLRKLPLELPPGFTFYLGTHHAADLATSTVPLFLSRRALVLDPAPRGSSENEWAEMDRQRRLLPVAQTRGGTPWSASTAIAR